MSKPDISSDVLQFIDANVIVTDPDTGKKGTFAMMQMLVNRRELFNDAQNPLHVDGFVPLVGENGSVTNLNAIHGKLGWHNQQVHGALWQKPSDLLIFYGYPNSFNSAVNGWDNEKVARDMAQYGLIVLGDGLQTLLASGSHDGSSGASTLTDSTASWTTDEFVGKKIVNVTDGSTGSITANTATTITATLSGGTENDWDAGDEYRVANHADYANVFKIVPRIKQYNPSAKIFGYVTVNQTLANFEDKADDWDALGVDGIFMDEAGYDYGTTATNDRDAFNAKVDYVHALSSASTCFANAWNMASDAEPGRDEVVGVLRERQAEGEGNGRGLRHVKKCRETSVSRSELQSDGGRTDCIGLEDLPATWDLEHAGLKGLTLPEDAAYDEGERDGPHEVSGTRGRQGENGTHAAV